MASRTKKRSNDPNGARDVAHGVISLGGYSYASEATQRLATATDSVFRDADQLRRIIDNFSKCDPAFTQGRAFEFLEVLKFNRDAALKGSELLAKPTHYTVSTTAPQDIIIEKAGRVVEEAQAKSIKDVAKSLRDLANEKYQGMQRLVPADTADRHAEILTRRLDHAPPGQLNIQEYEDVQRNLTGRLKHGQVSSPGTTRAEAEAAVESPLRTELTLKGTEALREVGKAGLTGAAVGGGLGLVFHGLMNAYHVGKGHKSHGEAIIDTIKGTAAVAARSGVVTSGAKVIAIAARQSGLTGFAGGAGPAVIANAVFEAAYALVQYGRGEIEADALREQAGGAVLRGAAAYYCGIAGQVLIPVPVVGALVGSVVGYTASAILLQSGILGVGPSSIVAQARKRREEIEAMCFEVIKRMELERAQIEAVAAAHALEFEKKVLPALDIFESSMVLFQPMAAMNALADLNEGFGCQLPFRSLTEFDEFMLDQEKSLEL